MPPFSYDQDPELAVEYKIQHYQGAQLLPFKMKIFHAHENDENPFDNQ